jgi:hypothetical protein
VPSSCLISPYAFLVSSTFTMWSIIFVFLTLHLSSNAVVISRDISAPFNVPWPQNTNFLDDHSWIPAALVANSSRSPCPMLNTLANHGFLPRDGRNISKDDFNSAQVNALNFSPDLASKTTDAMVAKLKAPENSSATFDLDDFAAHNQTEHDASLTRLDLIQGSTIDVNPGLVVKLLDDSDLSWLNTSSVGRSRARREAESITIGSPKLSDAFTSFAQLEASFILLVFGVGGDQDMNVRGAPKEQVKLWLNEERFPIEKSYARSATVLTTDMQQGLIDGIKKYHDASVGKY